MIKLDSERVKIELCRMLQELIDILENNGLNYSIWAGTLLGAVRHGGFIPWDDDIDIAMLRSDYERLVNIIRNNKDYTNHFIGFEIGTGDFSFVKYIDPNISVNRPYHNEKNLWIDIFPIDNIPEKYGSFFRKQRWSSILYWEKREQVNKELRPFHTRNSMSKLRYLALLPFVQFSSEQTIIGRLIENAKKYQNENSELIGNVINGFYEKEIFPQEWFKSFTTINFESLKVKTIKKYDLWLTRRYGDYMKLPPKEEQVNHGTKVYINSTED